VRSTAALENAVRSDAALRPRERSAFSRRPRKHARRARPRTRYAGGRPAFTSRRAPRATRWPPAALERTVVQHWPTLFFSRRPRERSAPPSRTQCAPAAALERGAFSRRPRTHAAGNVAGNAAGNTCRCASSRPLRGQRLARRGGGTAVAGGVRLSAAPQEHRREPRSGAARSGTSPGTHVQEHRRERRWETRVQEHRRDPGGQRRAPGAPERLQAPSIWPPS